jgi:hypothetical protein
MDNGGFFPEVKRPWLESDHSPPSKADVKKGVATVSLPNILPGMVFN